VDPAPAATSKEARAESFYASALRRILRILLALAILLPPAVWWRFGVAAALGVFLGGLVSWLNFRSLVSGVEGLMDRIANAQSHERGGSVILRFLLRYVLVGLVAYAIFRGSSQAFWGFLIALGLPVAAILGEAAYEAYGALRYGY
jgi:ATP synthase I subunit